MALPDQLVEEAIKKQMAGLDQRLSQIVSENEDRLRTRCNEAMEDVRAGRNVETDQEIKLYLKVIKTLAFRAKKSETVKNLKAMLHEHEGIPEVLQQLFFDGQQLGDEHKIMDCGIADNSTLHVFVYNSATINLHIKIPSKQTTIAVDAKFDDTIQCVKSIIEAKEGIQANDYSLHHDGNILEDSMSLASLNFQGEPTLHLVSNPKDVLPIYVKTPYGKLLKLQVKLLYTIGDVKNLIESNMPVGNWDLVHEEARLEGRRTLAYYELKENVILDMQPAAYQIFVKIRTGKTISLEVNHLTTISHVKNLIESDMPVGNWDLVHEEAWLEGRRTLAYYELKENVILEMRPAAYQIFVKIRTGKTISLEVNHLTTIAHVKNLIESDMPVGNWDLVHEEARLEGRRTLAYYELKENVILGMQPAAYQIFVKILTGKTISLEVNHLTTIAHVKNLIESDMPVGNWDLVHEEARLEGRRTLAYYELKENVILEMQPAAYQIFVKIRTGKTISLEVNHLTTIAHVKNLIKSDMPVGNWDLVHEEAWLEGRRTLAYYELKENVILGMQPAAYQIFVKIRTGKTISLEVNHLTTIAHVKNLIESDMPVGNWDLVHEEVRLEGWRTLAYYELKENVILEMQLATYQIFVKIWTRKSISLEVNHLTTIADVKHKVFLRTGMPADHVWLGFAGKVLKDHKRLVSYNIVKDSTLDAHCR